MSVRDSVCVWGGGGGGGGGGGVGESLCSWTYCLIFPTMSYWDTHTYAGRGKGVDDSKVMLQYYLPCLSCQNVWPLLELS